MKIAEHCNYRDGNEKGIKFNRDTRELEGVGVNIVYRYNNDSSIIHMTVIM